MVRTHFRDTVLGHDPGVDLLLLSTTEYRVRSIQTDLSTAFFKLRCPSSANCTVSTYSVTGFESRHGPMFLPSCGLELGVLICRLIVYALPDIVSLSSRPFDHITTPGPSVTYTHVVL